jgi:tetratricopeptide (TPR) repeat protein
MAYFINCRIDRNPMDISTSISYYREALKLRHIGHPDRPATLLHLAEVLLYHYGKLELDKFAGEIMEFASEVQASCSVDSHERRAADLALQTYALYKAISSGNLADIDRLILALRQAVDDIPHNYFDRLQRLTNLSLALRIRYEFCGGLSDLDESIATHEEAIQLTPCDLDSPTHTQFLKEWAKATLAGGSLKDALVTAAGVSISFFSHLPSSLTTLVWSSWFRDSRSTGSYVNILKQSTAYQMLASVSAEWWTNW